jgi:hypothetical protein
LDSYINIDKELEINPSINAPLKEKKTRFAMYKIGTMINTMYAKVKRSPRFTNMDKQPLLIINWTHFVVYVIEKI